MFSADTYKKRRARLKSDLQSTGLILLLGNSESPRNFPHNIYPFRQDSTFLYFFGLDAPGLAAIIDTDSGEQILFGDDANPDDIVWTGPLPPFSESAAKAGIAQSRPISELAAAIALQTDRPVHTIPTYQAATHNWMTELISENTPSAPLIRAIVAQRSYKTGEEIKQIERALEVSLMSHTAAMALTAPGKAEYEIVAGIHEVVASQGCSPSFNTIFSRRGEVLHNPYHHNTLEDGDFVVHDSGVETAMGYASDITRSFPVNGKFDQRQRDIYTIVLDSQQAAIDALAPGTPFRDLHGISARVILDGLSSHGIVKGDIDEALAADAHTLFFPCGLGHMMGLDVHDMEPIGEDFVGYDDDIQRNNVFGWRSLRLGRKLEPDWVVTVEPGIYFNGLLADRWRTDGTCAEFIDFDAFDKFRDFGGVRLEDDFLITEDGYRLLGEVIPKSIDAVEANCAAV